MPMPERDEEIDILRDECGVIWIAPVVTLVGAEIRAAVDLAEDVCIRAGFEPLFSLISTANWTAYVVTMLIYDKTDRAEDQRAIECSRDLVRRFAASGHYPYRLGIQSMTDLPASDDDTASVLAAIKRALDPNGILAPGRYEATARRP